MSEEEKERRDLISEAREKLEEFLKSDALSEEQKILALRKIMDEHKKETPQ